MGIEGIISLMKSPFPGMDPYLEAPAFWEGFHHVCLEVAQKMIGLEGSSNHVVLQQGQGQKRQKYAQPE